MKHKNGTPAYRGASQGIVANGARLLVCAGRIWASLSSRTDRTALLPASAVVALCAISDGGRIVTVGTFLAWWTSCARLRIYET